MDPIQHFAANSLTIAQIHYIHHEKDVPPYALAYRVSQPTFTLSKRIHHNTRLRRYYLNRRCLSTPWTSRKIGCLYTLPNMRPEDVKIGDVVCLDAKYKQKGMYGVSYLPPSWSRCVVNFFRYYSAPMKVRCMLESQETRQLLETHLVIVFCAHRIPTLYHMLTCLVTKNFSNIIDMLKFPRLRTTKFQTFEELQSAPLVKASNLYIPGTLEFIVELAFWAQDPELVNTFVSQLNKQIMVNPTNFKKEVREFLNKKDKTIIYMKRVLKHLSKTNLGL